MSTRATIFAFSWLHIYRDAADQDRLWVDFGPNSYNDACCFRIWPPRWGMLQ